MRTTGANKPGKCGVMSRPTPGDYCNFSFGSFRCSYHSSGNLHDPGVERLCEARRQFISKFGRIVKNIRHCGSPWVKRCLMSRSDRKSVVVGKEWGSGRGPEKGRRNAGV